MYYKYSKFTEDNDPLVKEALNTMESLKEIIEKHPNFLDDYMRIKGTYSKRILTTSKSGTFFGKFLPESTVLSHLNDKRITSKITQNEEVKEYACYFDSSEQLIMAEKYSLCDGTLQRVHLYYYYKDYTEIMVYDIKEAKIDCIRRIDYKNDKAIKYINWRYSYSFSDAIDIYRFYDDKIVETSVLFILNDSVIRCSFEIPKPIENDNICHEEKKETKKSNMKSDIKSEIKELIVKSINEVKDEDIYAFSLYVEDDGDETKPTVTFGYNTRRQYEDSVASTDSLEAKWNYAFWLQNELFVYGKDESGKVVQNWIEKKKLLEDDDCEDDDTPKVTRAFVKVLIKIVKELHKEKVLTAKFGKELPILIHELEYYEQIAEQNIKANGKSLLGDFLEFCPLGINDNEIASKSNSDIMENIEELFKSLDSSISIQEDMRKNLFNLLKKKNKDVNE